MSPESKAEAKKTRVGIIFGGRSGEHEVSLTSAKAVMQAIDQSKYEVVPIGITKSGQWLAGADVHQRLLEAAASHPALGEAGDQPAPESENSLVLPMAETGPLDVVFPILHGPFGEDGTIQGFLEMVDLPYIGAGVAASAVGMDKILSKQLFQAHGLAIVPYRVYLRKQWRSRPDSMLSDCESSFDYPMFVKPANLGSSVGIHKARSKQELQQGLDDAARYDRKLIVEQGLDARELEVSVLGNDEPLASVPGEIVPSREFYSYAAKYLDDSSELLIPAPLTEGQTTQIRQMAITAFRALDCAGLARCDFLLEKSTERLFLNELNTMPGFTPISMYPKLWEASGVSYTELIDRLIALAIERYVDRQQSKTSFDLDRAE